MEIKVSFELLKVIIENFRAMLLPLCAHQVFIFVNSIFLILFLFSLFRKPEMYDPARTYDPYEQYLLSCLSHKGLYPNEPIPDEINQKFSKSLQPVPELMEASATPLKHIKEIFPLEKVVHKTKKNLLNRLLSVLN